VSAMAIGLYVVLLLEGGTGGWGPTQDIKVPMGLASLLRVMAPQRLLGTGDWGLGGSCG